MSKKQKVLMGVLFSISSLAIIFIVIIAVNKQRKQDGDINRGNTYITEETLSDEQKEILNIKDKEDESDKEESKKQHEEKLEDSRTDEYKEYENLSDEKKAQYEVVPREYKVPDETLDEIIEDQETDSDLPSYYSLADHIKLHVGNQGDFGLCWAFASLTAVETYAQLHGYGELNLSEIQLDYLSSDKMYGDRTPHHGGTIDVLKKYAAMGLAPVSEQSNEYSDKTDEEILSYFNSEALFDTVKTVDFPALDKDSATDEEISKFRDAVKRHIMENGALYAVTQGTPLENANNTKDSEPNHAMAIVGWDDNYPASKWAEFNGEDHMTIYSQNQKQPTHDGAYILLDSYGEENGKDGYVYIYYDDYWIERHVSGVISLEYDEDELINLADIRNENVRNYLKNNYDLYIKERDDKELLPKSVLERQYFDFDNMGLSDEDAEQIIALAPDSSFALTNNNITKISSIAGMDNTYINLSGNPIEDIDDIKDETKTFNCNDCRLSGEIDLSETHLDTIILSGNENITSYKFPSEAKYITISNNDLSEIDLSYLDDVAYLNLSNNPNLTDLSKLPNQVSTLMISGTGVKELSALSGMQLLNLEANNLSNLTSLYGIPGSLKNLDISNCPQIKDYSALSSISDSLNLNISNNNLSSIEFLNDYFGADIALSLNASNNSITEIPALNYKTGFLNLANNKIESGLENINESIMLLSLEGNNLSDLSGLPENSSINTLNVSDNPVSDLSGLNNLKSLQSLSVGNGSAELNGVINAPLLYLSISSTDISNLKFPKAQGCISLKDVTATDYKTLTGSIDLKNGNFNSIAIDGVSTNDFDLYTLLLDNTSDYYSNDKNRSVSIMATNYAITEQQRKELKDARTTAYTFDKNVYISGEPIILDADGTYYAKNLAERNLIVKLYSSNYKTRAKDGSYVVFSDSVDSVTQKSFYPLYENSTSSRGDTYYMTRKIQRD